jgi:hypothetical protein
MAKPHPVVYAREGALERAKKDLRPTLGSIRFIGAGAVLGTVAGVGGVTLPAHTALGVRLAVGALSGGAAVAVIGLIVFLALWIAAPVRRRDDARDEVERLQREANPEFPRHSLDLGKRLTQLTLPANHPDAGKRVVFLRVEFTNREPRRKVSLDFDVMYTYRDIGTFSLFHYRGLDIPEIFASPLAVDPETHVKRKLCLAGDFDWVFDSGDPDDIYVTINPNAELTLHVTDHVTGAVVEYPVPREEDSVVDGSGGEGQDDSLAGEPSAETRDDGQVGVELDAPDSANAEGE